VIHLPGRIVAGALAAGLLAGCTSSKPAKVVTVTQTRSPTPATSSAGPTAGSSSPAGGTPSPTASHQTRISGTCDTLLPDGSIYSALKVDTLPGTDAFVVGKPEPDIGRLGYLNCRYGVTGKGAAATPAVEIGISLYDTAGDAASRITATVDDYTAHGASSSQVTVDRLPATMLTGGVGDGYAVPLLVVASGQRTVAVSIAGSVATGQKAVTDATALASLALERTAR
jgi:hypothetical protein